ncbi:hypothetical protein [Thermomonas sp.]|uniref:hypothetical protein n=1 Tax=Thermomonas sp. TaxID=1971895 RepID=UPI00261A56EC|nr:hypothetical protein [Thermomonas sp.]
MPRADWVLPYTMRQLADRVHQHQPIQQQADQLADPQFRARHVAAGQAQQQQHRAGPQHVHHRRDRPFQPRAAQVDVAHRLHLPGIAPRLHRIGGEGLDDRQHRQVLLRHRGLVRPRLHRLMRKRAQPPPDQLEQHEQQRHQHADGDGDRRGHPQHHQQRTDEGEQQRHQRHQGAGHVGAQPIDVPGQQRQHVAALARMVPGQRQRLQVRIHMAACIGHQPPGHRLQLDRDQVADGLLGHDQSEQDPQQRPRTRAKQQAIGQYAAQPGLGKGRGALHEHQDQCQRQHCHVWPQQARHECPHLRGGP